MPELPTNPSKPAASLPVVVFFFAFSNPPSLPGLEGSEGEPASMNPRDSASALSTVGNSLEKPQRSKLNSEPFDNGKSYSWNRWLFGPFWKSKVSGKNWMAFFLQIPRQAKPF